jgi:hypothetical protein
MKIRSITIFIDPFYPLNPHVLKQAGEFIKAAQPAFTNNGYEVQSTRLATAAFSQLFRNMQRSLNKPLQIRVMPMFLWDLPCLP